MRKDLNKVVVVGRLTANPEFRIGKNGNGIARLRVASNYGEYATFVTVKAFRKLADVCNQYLHKGDTVLIEGRLNNYKSNLEVVAQSVKFLNTKSAQQNEPF